MTAHPPVPGSNLESLEALLRGHHDPLVRIAGLLTGDPGRAERLVQDAFVDVHHRPDQGDDPATAVALLRRAVVTGSRAARWRRRLARRASDDALLDVTGVAGDGSGRADERALGGLQQRAIVDRLAELPGRQREVLVLRYYGRWTGTEIAAALSVSPGAVETLRSRGLAALRPVLAGEQ